MLKKKIINPSIEETTRVIDNQLKEDRPVLVAVSSEFSLKTMINKMTLIKAEDSGLTVAYIDNFTPTIEGKYWLNRYKKEYSNLYILFSNRYKQGIVLPSYLPDVDFKLAIKNFN